MHRYIHIKSNLRQATNPDSQIEYTLPLSYPQFAQAGASVNPNPIISASIHLDNSWIENMSKLLFLLLFFALLSLSSGHLLFDPCLRDSDCRGSGDMCCFFQCCVSGQCCAQGCSLSGCDFANWNLGQKISTTDEKRRSEQNGVSWVWVMTYCFTG